MHSHENEKGANLVVFQLVTGHLTATEVTVHRDVELLVVPFHLCPGHWFITVLTEYQIANTVHLVELERFDRDFMFTA